MFRSIKNSYEVLSKLKARGFRASSLSTYDFSTLYTTCTLPHNLIKDKLVDLIERTFHREGSLYIACNDKNAFFTFLLDNIYIRFGSKLYRQRGVSIRGYSGPLPNDFIFCR